MGKLFEAETLQDKLKKLSDKQLGPVLMECRRRIGKSEDKWVGEDEAVARAVLAEMIDIEFSSIDPTVITPRMQLARKNKALRKLTNNYGTADRLHRIANDFRREQEEMGWQHLSQQYVDYIQSEQWRRLASEHKRRCQFLCQLCGRDDRSLEVHHTPLGYQHLGNELPHHILCLCSNPCHPLADKIRHEVGRYGSEAE